MFEEMREISRATDLPAIIVRYSDTACERSRISFDVFHEDAWHARHLLWIDEDELAGWLLPDLGVGASLRLSQWGLELCVEAPYAGLQDRITGLDRGAQYINSFPRWR